MTDAATPNEPKSEFPLVLIAYASIGAERRGVLSLARTLCSVYDAMLNNDIEQSVRARMNPSRPPGFSNEEWDEAIASGRLIVVAQPRRRRPWWSGLPRPLAGTSWLIARAIRARLDTTHRRLATYPVPHGQRSRLRRFAPAEQNDTETAKTS
jgi:hypothetical protein